uniref:Telomere-associated protein RIF1 isoform X2 n=1 Tax=Geotrypetes seraphini TaxID=260995 RepID=A0A6P8QQG9_GEOSA|nr:telomere-associated protein RIF1 isoform X2 [Geotrypetes seraphini]
MSGVRAEDSLLPLLETLEDSSVSCTEQTDAYLALANRLSGEEGQMFTGLIGKQFTRLYKVLKVHISVEDSELNNAALQALGFCVFNTQIASGLSVAEIQELLTCLNHIAKETSDKNTCTRALWVISKQNFSSEEVGKAVPSILSALETILNKEDVQSLTIEYEALNVVIRLLEQTPAQMGVEAVRWAKLIIPLVVHAAFKVRLRGATALELGMPLLLQKQQEVASVTEHLMITKIIPELQKLFSTKNETFVLKLWPLFVKLLGKSLHRSGSFINSLLQLEELGFRSGSPAVKKIAFIAWKGLIDNFALNPDILCSSKRLRLLMQPLSSIHVRTESLALTKLEVWWYLLMRLGPQLPGNFEQLCAPLIQSTLNIDSPAAPQGTPRGAANQSLNSTPVQKTGCFPFSAATTPRMNLNSSVAGTPVIPSIQLLGIEMLLHFLLGPEVLTFAKQNNLALSLEPLQHPLISSSSFFCKHANTILSAIQDGFIAVGKNALDAMLNIIWKDVIAFVKAAIESGNKRERQGSEVLTLLLKTLKNIVVSNALPVQKTLTLLETTIKGLPQKVLGSPAYQMANMDLLNGTPALFLVQLFFQDTLLEHCVKEERFFVNLETLVGCVLSGPTSPLTFSESVLGVLSQSAKLLENKEYLWRMWSIVVSPLTEWINQTNEVNQGDALEHNFSAVHSALTLPVIHIFPVHGFPQPTMKSLLRTWSELYRAFARCADLVSTTEENVCCEELCAKILHGIEDEALISLSFLDGITQCITTVVECVNFSPYSIKFQAKTKAPHTPTDWSKRRREPLGNLTSLLKILVKLINSFHALNYKVTQPEAPTSALVTVGSSIIVILSSIISNISLTSAIRALFAILVPPLTSFYERNTKSVEDKVYSSLGSKLEKLLGDIFHCLQSRYTGTYDSELLDDLSSFLCVTFPHKNKQIRNQTIQFWNATFAKATLLRYHEDLRPILSQIKQKVPLLLPGFEGYEVVESSSGPYSDPTENSQLNPKISGIEIKLTGKRDSMLARAEDLKNRDPVTHGAQVKLKLDFSSPKKKISARLLEEEKSVDFVFIPPETKQRLLTEHQKEMFRTKRVDIPVMYNNLDASQDATSFNQYTQSQEDSLEKITVTESMKEDCGKLSEEEKMDIEVSSSTQEVTREPSKTVSLVENGVGTAEGYNIKEEPENLCESACKETSIGDVSTEENTSNVSSTSSSSDIVSGTPPHPASRRQSFITLEKFDSSVSRPFSPSSLIKFSTSLETVSKCNNEECMNTAEMVVKKIGEPGEEYTNNSIPEPPKTAVEIKRTARRSISPEYVDNNDELPLRLQEKDEHKFSTLSVFTESLSAADRCSQPEGKECIPDNQSPIIDSCVQGPTIEDKNVLDSDTEILTYAKPDIESKENTPPEMVPDQASIGDPQSMQTASSQKLLRRSSRRRSDISGTLADSQDKEKVSQQLTREMTKDERKHFQKKVMHTKDEGLLRQKNIDDQEIINKKNGSHENIQEENSNKRDSLSEEEMSKSVKEFEADDLKSERHFLQDSCMDKWSRKKNRGCTRYQTRRSAQELLPSLTNSESSSVELKEVTKRKRMGKGKAKNISSQENEEGGREEKSENENLDQHPPKTVTNSDTLSSLKIENDSGSDMEAGSSKTCEMEICTVETKLRKLDSECSTGLSSVNLELGKTSDEREYSSTELCISVPDVERESSDMCYVNRGVKKTCSSLDGSVMEQTVGDVSTAVSDVCLQTESSLQQFVCHHKRSKRVRRSKSCDCCGEKIHLHEKSEEKMPLQTSTAMVVDLQLDDSVFDPCAISTPLFSMKHPCISKISMREQQSDLESDQENTVLEAHNNEIKEKNKFILKNEATAIEAIEQDVEIPEPCSLANFSSKGPIDHDLTSEPENEQPLSLENSKKVIENRMVEQVADAEVVVVTNAEERTIDGPNTDNIESDKEERGERIKIETNYVANNETKDILLEGASDSTAENVTTEEQVFETSGDVSSETNCVTNNETKDILLVSEGASDSTAENVTTEEQVFETSGDVSSETNCVTNNETKDILLVSEGASDSTAENVTTEEQVFETSRDVSSETNCVTNNETKDILLVSEGASDSTAENVITEEQVVETSKDVGSPRKPNELDTVLDTVNESPSGIQARCLWSPSASPCTSILKKGVKRAQENDSPSPINKVRRVSFADPIYKEELADNIDRRSPVVRSSSVSNGSPAIRTLKTSPCVQASKHITTPTKGFHSPGSRSLGFKSSKKCLITEMTKESMPSPKESIYPQLVNCTTPVDFILPQITSNLWARGLGQLIRAKNIKTVGDLSTLTPTEIKTLPIRSPKVSTVKKALRVYHEQQMKSRGIEEFLVFEDVVKPVNGLDEKSLAPEEEKFETDTPPVASDPQSSTRILAQINTLATQITTEDLSSYSGAQLFEMQEKINDISNCIIGNLQSRWKSLSHENSA